MQVSCFTSMSSSLACILYWCQDRISQDSRKEMPVRGLESEGAQSGKKSWVEGESSSEGSQIPLQQHNTKVTSAKLKQNLRAIHQRGLLACGSRSAWTAQSSLSSAREADRKQGLGTVGIPVCHSCSQLLEDSQGCTVPPLPAYRVGCSGFCRCFGGCFETGWLPTCCVAKDDFDLFLHPKCWDCRSVQPMPGLTWCWGSKPQRQVC